MVNPGIIRKREAELEKDKRDKVLSEGPIGLLLTYILDIILGFGKLILNMISEYRSSGSKFIYDALYKDGSRLIPSYEKYGSMINLKPFRIIICIMYPPLGIFLARGIYGLHYAIIAFILSYMNMLVGICFALVIIHIYNYGDKFEKYEYYRLLTIKQLIKECDVMIVTEKKIVPLIIFISIIILLIFIFYIFIKYV
jgi:uncharacterized membrane protein YqaE (UPF0057 family)